MPEKKSVKAVIKGRVQGVYFRASTKEQADLAGVKGYVKNLSDGSVEALFQGDESKVKKVISWCHKGPANAGVTEVTVSDFKTGETFTQFEIRYY